MSIGLYNALFNVNETAARRLSEEEYKTISVTLMSADGEHELFTKEFEVV